VYIIIRYVLENRVPLKSAFPTDTKAGFSS